MACDMPAPCKFPSLDSSQKRILWAHKEAVLNLHLIIWSYAQRRRCREVSSGTWSRKLGSLSPFLRVSMRGPCLRAIQEDGGDKWLVQLKLACKADGASLSDARAKQSVSRESTEWLLLMRNKLFISFITTCQSSTPVCHWPASGWCPSCGSRSWLNFWIYFIPFQSSNFQIYFILFQSVWFLMITYECYKCWRGTTFSCHALYCTKWLVQIKMELSISVSILLITPCPIIFLKKKKHTCNFYEHGKNRFL